MRFFERGMEPDFLTINWEQWGKSWAEKREANPNAVFYWHQYQGEFVNRRLLGPLKQQTQDHCSFCDQFPVSPPSIETIEHFKPKAAYPLDAFKWSNLYFCCTFCQQKKVPFNEAVLRPDAADYTFDRYFRWDYTTGRIEVNELATEIDKMRAEATILLYHLNDEHPSLRKRELRKRSQSPNDPINDFAYRYYISA